MDSSIAGKGVRILFSLFCFVILSNNPGVTNAQGRKVSEAFRIKDKNLIPEGIAYDPADKSFYVGSITQRKIVRVNSKGKISDFAVSLHQILGMKVDTLGRKLWVCGNAALDSGEFVSAVYVFSIPEGSLLKKYQITGKKRHLFNDVVITSGGDAYVTDSSGGGVYIIQKSHDAIEEFVKPGSIPGPNGIALTPDEKRILVATAGRLGIASVDLESREIGTLQSDRYLLIGYDGIYRYRNSIIGVQNVTFPEGVLQLTCDEAFTKVEKVEFVAVSVPEFHIPTTGVVVGDHFYFIANSHVDQVAENNGQIRDPAAVTEPVVLKVKL